MGMFDSFYFAPGILPDNLEGPEQEFQSKHLACQLNVYRIDEYRNVKAFNMNNEPIQTIEAAKIQVYSHNFDVKPTRVQYYTLVIVDGFLRRATKDE